MKEREKDRQGVKALVLGLDGFDPNLVSRFFEEGELPNLSALAQEGFFAPLESTEPATTFPAWTSFFTGAPPSYHGVPDFTVRKGYSVGFIGAHQRKLPTLMEHLEAQGHTVGAAWFPVMYPPLPLQGYCISGWDSPVTTEGDTSFVHPRDLGTDLKERFSNKHLSFDPLDEFSLSQDDSKDPARLLVESIARKTEMAKHLLRSRPVDVAMFYFGESDTASHHYFAHMDKGSPRHPSPCPEHLSRVIRRTYAALDEAVGELIEEAGPQAVVVLSDHGSGGSSDLAVHLNRALHDAGLLSFRTRRILSSAPGLLRGDLVSLLPRSFRRPLFKLAGGAVPGAAESRIRFGGIDWKNTCAFSEEISYAPGVWLNQLGREPKGVVPYRHRTEYLGKAREALLSVQGPGGEQMIDEVVPREEIHQGENLHLFPDLIVRPSRPGGYTPVFLPSEGKPGPVVRRLAPLELLGKKGRSMPGCHTPEGVLFARGKKIEPGMSSTGVGIQHVAALLCDLLDVERAEWFHGAEALSGLFGKSKEGISHEEVSIQPSRPYTAAEEEMVAKRLAGLGYLEE